VTRWIETPTRSHQHADVVRIGLGPTNRSPRIGLHWRPPTRTDVRVVHCGAILGAHERLEIGDANLAAEVRWEIRNLEPVIVPMPLRAAMIESHAAADIRLRPERRSLDP